MPALKTPTCPDIQPIHIETLGIYTLLSELDPHKASGPDSIQTRLLKELAYSVAPVLALIFNASLHQDKLPVDWKTATVVLVFKKSSRTDPINYRPISLTCVCCKVFEHIISSQYLTMQIFIISYVLSNMVLGNIDLVKHSY